MTEEMAHGMASVNGLDFIDDQIIVGMDVRGYDGISFETVGMYANAGYYGIWQLTSSGWTRAG